ncbi:hypothetical protein [Nonomuraea sp. NPDC005650]|uniref:hypothetical protein n=1 Tax=Nonomuraea sp. NPDC005650 TaxID=3157045 RepID=UPI0033AE917B
MKRLLPPTPPQIAALPTERGFPVPWVADWADGEERVEFDPVYGRTLICDCVPGEGRATLGVNCSMRQRQGMRQRLCGTCGNPLTGPMVMIGEKDMPYSLEPGLHVDCAVFSLLACPKLVHASERAGVVVLDGYTLLEDRIFGVCDGELVRHLLPSLLGAVSGAVLAFLVAVIPDNAQRFRTADWLDANRHVLTAESPTPTEGQP